MSNILSEEEREICKTLETMLVEKTIRLSVKKDAGLTGYESGWDEEIQVTINKKTYDKFEEEAEKLGLDVDEALASLLLGHLQRLGDC